jgi:hypothetical protein
MRALPLPPMRPSRSADAYHDGYRRFGVRHERSVTAFAGRRWQVIDQLLSHHLVPVVIPPALAVTGLGVASG